MHALSFFYWDKTFDDSVASEFSYKHRLYFYILFYKEWYRNLIPNLVIHLLQHVHNNWYNLFMQHVYYWSCKGCLTTHSVYQRHNN